MWKSKILHLLLAFVLGVVCLYLFARDMNWAEVWSAMTKASYRWIILAVLLNFVGMYIRALRWQSFLSTPKVGVNKLFLIMNVGFMGNGVLPFRMGEFIRPILVGRLTPHRFSSTLATIVVERVFDLLGILLCMAFVLMTFTFPDMPAANTGETIVIEGSEQQQKQVELPENPRLWIQDAGLVAMLMFLGLLATTAFMTYAPNMSLKIAAVCFRPLPTGLQQKLLGMVESFEQGASTFRRPMSFAYCFFLTMLLWLVMAFSEWLILWAFGIHHVGYNGALLIMVALCFAVMFPQLPGFIGVYQYALTLVLVQIFAINKEEAGAVSMVMWLSQIPPVILVGFLCLLLLGVSFQEISQVDDSPASLEYDSTTDKPPKP